jgi:hypothetical protein
MKAAVIKADWFDPDLNPKLQSFCEHYGNHMALLLRQVTGKESRQHSVCKAVKRIRSLCLAEQDLIFRAIPPALLVHIKQHVEIRWLIASELLLVEEFDCGMDRTAERQARRRTV